MIFSGRLDYIKHILLLNILTIGLDTSNLQILNLWASRSRWQVFCSHFELGSPVLRFNVQIGVTLLGSTFVKRSLVISLSFSCR